MIGYITDDLEIFSDDSNVDNFSLIKAQKVSQTRKINTLQYFLIVFRIKRSCSQN